jgi:hypothetical protein
MRSPTSSPAPTLVKTARGERERIQGGGDDSQKKGLERTEMVKQEHLVHGVLFFETKGIFYSEFNNDTSFITSLRMGVKHHI